MRTNLFKIAQQKIAVEKKLSESILENSINGILAFDNHGRITKWNKHLEFLSGKKKEEVIGKPLNELFPEYAGSEEGDAVRQALRGKKVTLRKHDNLFGLKNRFYDITLMP